MNVCVGRYVLSPHWDAVGPPSSLDPIFITSDLALFSDLPYGQWEQTPPRFKPFISVIEKLTCRNKRDLEIQWLKGNNTLFLC